MINNSFCLLLKNLFKKHTGIEVYQCCLGATSAKVLESQKLEKKEKDELDVSLTIFHKPSKNLVNFSDASKYFKLKQFSKIFSDEISRNDVVNIRKTFPNIFQSISKPLRGPPSDVRELRDEDILSVKDLMWKEAGLKKESLVSSLLALSKFRLTSLVVLTSVAGYVIAPGPFYFSSFFSCTLGVFLTSSAANSINQFFEVPYDSQMSRTMNRPIVKGIVLSHQAVCFASFCTLAGTSLLFFGANPLTSVLGLCNIFLYTHMYTPMKRTSIFNTWVGSVVGAIPPVMGWTAVTGSLDLGAFLLGGVLFAWQFPHFCALSWNLKEDYSRAGYRMMSVVDPDLCKKVSLKYSLALIVLSFAFPMCDVTTWTFAVDSLPLNAYLCYLAWNFYRQGDSQSSRKLFRFTLLHLPLILVFLVISKKNYSAKAYHHIKSPPSLKEST